MGQYVIPQYAVNEDDGELVWTSMTTMRTMGRARPDRMDVGQRITRKRLSKANWDQLTAISKGTYVNHLGRGHHRDTPLDSEHEWNLRYFKMDDCLRCTYGVFYHHTCDPNRAAREGADHG